MTGVITPKSQPLDKIINKIWKGYFCDEYYGFILTAPVNEKKDNHCLQLDNYRLSG